MTNMNKSISRGCHNLFRISIPAITNSTVGAIDFKPARRKSPWRIMRDARSVVNHSRSRSRSSQRCRIGLLEFDPEYRGPDTWRATTAAMARSLKLPLLMPAVPMVEYPRVNLSAESNLNSSLAIRKNTFLGPEPSVAAHHALSSRYKI